MLNTLDNCNVLLYFIEWVIFCNQNNQAGVIALQNYYVKSVRQ